MSTIKQAKIDSKISSRADHEKLIIMVQKVSKIGSKDSLQNQARGGAGGIQCYQNSYIIMNEQPRPTTRARIRRARRAELLVTENIFPGV